MYENNLALVACKNTRGTPTERMSAGAYTAIAGNSPKVIHLPKRVQRQEEREQRNGENVDCNRVSRCAVWRTIDSQIIQAIMSHRSRKIKIKA